MLKARLSQAVTVIGICLVGLVVALPAQGQPVERYSDLSPDFVPAAPGVPGAPAAPVGGLVFYSDRGLFTSDFPGLTSEDYTGTSIAPDSVSPCVAPMNSASNDACFSPGAIVDGVSVDVVVVGGLGEGVVLTPAFSGTTSVSTGPNSFADDMVIDLTVPATAFGLDLVCPIAAATIGVEIFGTGGSLATTSVNCAGPPGTFWGVSADENIVSIEFIGTTGNDGELASNVLFGGAPVPTFEMPAIALLFVALLAVSAFFVWRRRVV